uniref:Uncharacterized protein n=1 Tax=Wuchereria bancrofti TaxID=6293 RepID=A0AAF5PJG5_WUCBA
MTEVLCGSTDIGCGDAFDFLNCVRNMTFESMGVKAAMMKSTDTTVDDLLMNADSRATAGNIIADKHCEKVHKLTDSIYVCGAGTAADLNQVELNTGKKARVITALWRAKQHLFSYMGHTQSKPFASEGSGSYTATTILERDFKVGMTQSLLKLKNNSILLVLSTQDLIKHKQIIDLIITRSKSY